MKILVTGGAGYIGSIATAMLLDTGYQVNVLDDLSTGHADSLPENVKFINGSLLSESDLENALDGCEAVMHFAAKSLVGESVVKPEKYWSTNVTGTATLLTAMRGMNVKKLVFSSSAATYGEPKETPITEESETRPTNPYGASKLAADNMLTSESIAHGLGAISLRYFNVAGAYNRNGNWLSERHDPETHLIPNILRSTNNAPIKIFGTDWPTEDGTCVRDYVHVVDLIEAHILALQNLPEHKHEIINLGSGSGYSVRQVIDAAAKSVGHQIPSIAGNRRAGDPAVLIADISKAKSYLQWQPKRDIEEMVLDSWKAMKS